MRSRQHNGRAINVPKMRVQSMVYALTGHDPEKLTTKDVRQRRHCLAIIESQLTRERNKGRVHHWSYDLNRHLALKAARDLVADTLR